MARYGVIGASGFVGRHLTRELIQRGHTVRAIVRTAGSAPNNTEEVALGDFTAVTDWKPALDGLDVVICLAARVHVMTETEADPLTAFRRINVGVTREIAGAAAAAGIGRLVFISSIKVNGEGTIPGRPYRASDQPHPIDPYGISKLEAEDALKLISAETGLEVAIIRPPLVYGPGVGGNFLKLLKLAGSGIPIPLGSVKNARAMISIDNLADAIAHYSSVPIDGAVIALVNDQESISTSALLRMIARAAHKPSRLIPFPASILKAMLNAIGKRAEAERLLGTLDVEISSDPPSPTWVPPHATEVSLAATTSWFFDNRGGVK